MSYYIITTSVMLQAVLKHCGQQGDASDPHDLYHACQERAQGKDGLCTKDDTCTKCAHLAHSAWQHIYTLRQRREKR